MGVGSWSFSNHPSASKNKKKAVKKFSGKKMPEPTPSNKPIATPPRLSANQRLKAAMGVAADGLKLSSKKGLGVDVEPIETFENYLNQGKDDFFKRNFTEEELDYCYNAPHPAASFAGRWAAKEAVIKAISSSSPETGNLGKGAGAPLKDIGVSRSASGAPSIEFTGHASEVVRVLGIEDVSISISH